MFRKENFYIHERFMDVCVLVKKIYYFNKPYFKVKVEWWNRGQCGTPYPLNLTQVLTIHKKDFPMWKELEI